MPLQMKCAPVAHHKHTSEVNTDQILTGARLLGPSIWPFNCLLLMNMHRFVHQVFVIRSSPCGFVWEQQNKPYITLFCQGSTVPWVTWYNEGDVVKQLTALAEVSTNLKTEALTSCVSGLLCLADGGACVMSDVLTRKKLLSCSLLCHKHSAVESLINTINCRHTDNLIIISFSQLLIIHDVNCLI